MRALPWDLKFDFLTVTIRAGHNWAGKSFLLMILDLALHSGGDCLKDNGKGEDDIGDQADLTQVEIVPARHVEIETDPGCPGCGTHHDRGSEIHFETQESPG